MLIKTFGCKVNQADSDTLCHVMDDHAFVTAPYNSQQPPVDGQVVIVNACCVTAEAERKALQFVRKVHRANPCAEILLTGCSARNPSSTAAYTAAGAVLTPTQADILAWFKARQTDAVPAGSTEQTAGSTAHGSRTRAFIKVQDGCCNYCAYCIVPFVRPFASKQPSQVYAEVRHLLQQGKHELVLTGVNIGHYGMTPWRTAGTDPHEPAQYELKPGGMPLEELLGAILADLPTGTRLRLSSIEPDTVTPGLLQLFTDPRMCPHLHMPLQSGSDAVLVAMRRRYTARGYLDLVEKFRCLSPDGAVTADILTGYPTETEADFAATVAVCQAARFERIHCFPYSPRPGTLASRLPQLPPATVQQRNRDLIKLGRDVASAAWARFLGATARVLIEEPDAKNPQAWLGHGAAYQIVSARQAQAPAQAEDLHGRIVPVRLESYHDGTFSGVILSGFNAR